MSQEPPALPPEETPEPATEKPANSTRRRILCIWAIVSGLALLALLLGWHPTCDDPLGTMSSPLPSQRKEPPTSARDYLLAASKHLGAGRDEEGLAYIRKAVALEPNNAKAQMMLGDCYRAYGLRSDAIEAYKKVIAIDGNGNWGQHAKDGLEAMSKESQE